MSDLKLDKFEPFGKYQSFIKAIPYGEDNAISQKELSVIWKTSERDVRRIITIARMDGNVIAATEHGYFYPTTGSELLRYFGLASARVRTSHRCLVPVKKLIDEYLSEMEEYYETLFSDEGETTEHLDTLET